MNRSSLISKNVKFNALTKNSMVRIGSSTIKDIGMLFLQIDQRRKEKKNFFLFYLQTYFVSISFVEKQNPTKAFLVDQDKGVGKKVSTLFKPIADR